MDGIKTCFVIRAFAGFADVHAFPLPAVVGLIFAIAIMSSSFVFFQPNSEVTDTGSWSTNFIAFSIVEGVNGVKVDDGIISSSFMAFAY